MYPDFESEFGVRPPEEGTRERFWTSVLVLAVLAAMLIALLFV